MRELGGMFSGTRIVETHDAAVALARKVIEQFRLADLEPLLHSVQAQTAKAELNLAVFGRLKAGKSSFLNQLLGQPILPVGVVPVTSVVTEICYGDENSAWVTFQGHREPQRISLAEIASYTSERDNPQNRKQVKFVRVMLSALEPLRYLKLVDTPGLESIFAHNTEATLSWSPNVDLALVAVSVDPPLTQQDTALIERLQRFTPNVSILLTKMDTLDAAGQREVLAFVEDQMKARFPDNLRVYPFSIRPGYENLREAFDREYIAPAIASFQSARFSTLERKLRTLLESIAGYLRFALHAAEASKSDCESLRSLVLGAEQSLADEKLQFRLLAQHADAQTRPFLEQRLRETVSRPLEAKLQERLRTEFPIWKGSFADTLTRFETWLRSELHSELATISAAESDTFQTTLRDLQRQCREHLQAFREQLSERVLRLTGSALQTSETEIEVRLPKAPDVSVGKVFDHSWELISALIPMWLVRAAIRRRFADKVQSEVEKNLSRLTSQWEENLRKAIGESEKEAERRFDELVFTVRRLLSASDTGKKETLLRYGGDISAALEQLEASG
jgi:GTP-binding protein EngB required for normal cell division